MFLLGGFHTGCPIFQRRWFSHNFTLSRWVSYWVAEAVEFVWNLRWKTHGKASISHLLGGLEHEFYMFPNSWDDDPIWRTPSFFRGVGLNHQLVMENDGLSLDNHQSPLELMTSSELMLIAAATGPGIHWWRPKNGQRSSTYVQHPEWYRLTIYVAWF